MTAWDNFRKFVIASPPWIIFMLSLALMAVGVLVLAYRLRVDPDYGKKHALSRVHLCHSLEEPGTKKQTLPFFPINVSIPVAVQSSRLLSNFISNSSKALTLATGRFYSGQMGLKGLTGHSHNWTFLMPLTKDVERCLGDQMCVEAVWYTCLILSADEAVSLPDVPTEQNCGNLSTLSHDVKEFDVITLSNIADGSQSGHSLSEHEVTQTAAANTASPATTAEQFCAAGIKLEMGIDKGDHFVLIPMLHDTMMARLHLLYTSYFLFTMLLFLLCYAMCKGHNFHKIPRHAVPSSSAEDLIPTKAIS